jgi:hypothetical protein
MTLLELALAWAALIAALLWAMCRWHDRLHGRGAGR